MGNEDMQLCLCRHVLTVLGTVALSLKIPSPNGRMNCWGYSTVSFFAPMLRYSSTGMANAGRDAINEFKMLVREAHKRGIEVTNHLLLMVIFVFNILF